MKNKINFPHSILIIIFLMCCNISFAQKTAKEIQKKCGKNAKCWTEEYNKVLSDYQIVLRQKSKINDEYDRVANENIVLENKNKELSKNKTDNIITGNHPAPQKTPISIGNNNCEKRLQELRDSFNQVIQQKELLIQNSNNKKNCEKEVNNLKSAKARLKSDNDRLKRENQQIQNNVKKLKERYSQATKVNKEYYKSPAYKNESLHFSGHNFETFVVTDPSTTDIKVYIRNQKNRLASLADLNKHIENKGEEVLFSTNGGMYNSRRESQGYLVINNGEIKKIDTKDPKDGTNFYLKPNGIFYIDKEGKAGVLETDQYNRQNIQPKYATQSGPMLVVNGKIHPILNPMGKSKKIRSGVGVDKEGRVFFAISNEPVNFHTFAYLFKKEFNCENALFLDGTVSKTYSKHGKKELGGDFGPMIAVLPKKAPKAVQPEDPKQRDQPKQNNTGKKTDPFQE